MYNYTETTKCTQYENFIMKLTPPYALFLGDACDSLGLKMDNSIATWRKSQCVGEITLPECSVTTGLTHLSIKDAADNGAKSFVLGFNNAGGHIDTKYLPYIKLAIEKGMHIVNGLHDKLSDIPELVALADKYHVDLVDIRHPTTRFKTANGQKRTGKRLLTVGTDCSVGKMYTTLALHEAMISRGMNATFRATGQCGILVAGEGVAVDCVVSDFISGAVEALTPDNAPEHWDFIEGQGSLFQPAFAGVTLGLIHGAQPDALVVCHTLRREFMRGMPGYKLPTVQQAVELNLLHARLTNPNCKVIGISLNTSAVDEKTARETCLQISQETGLACQDPIRHGVDGLINQIA